MPRFTIVIVLGLCGPLATPAQQRPSFVGQWVRADSAAPLTVAATGDARFRVGDMGSGWGSPLTITQTADSLVVAYTHFSNYDLQPKLRYAFALNGAPSISRVIVGHATSEQTSRARWEGETLVITTTHPAPPEISRAPIEVKQSLSLDASGRLVIETVRPGASSPNVVRTTYGRP